MSKIPSINKRSFDQQAADWIRGAMMSGDLAPGTRVTELALAERIGLSRSTVRAAMQRLAREGLLVQRAYAGWEVASFSPEDAWELYTLRGELEGLASKLAAERLDAVSRRTLVDALNELRTAVEGEDPRSVVEADLGLHRAIVGSAKHQRLSMLHAQIIDPIQLYVLSTNRESFDDLIPVHSALVEAILRGDSADAESLARGHVTFSCEQIVRHLRQLTQGKRPANPS